MKELLASLKLLSDESRLRVLMLVSRKELCVCQIMGVLNMSQPLVSRNLSLLMRGGFLQDRREGKLIFYRRKENLSGIPLMLLSVLQEPLKGDKILMKDLSSLVECEEFQKKTGKCDMETLKAFMSRKKKKESPRRKEN
ncbi:MAG TPA: metalloregulator ArsR/SmtB family transcription factor [Dissulfurispiraceae bacterium]